MIEHSTKKCLRVSAHILKPLKGNPNMGFDFTLPSLDLKGSSDLSDFIFEINVGKRRIRHTTTLKLTDEVLDRLKIVRR